MTKTDLIKEVSRAVEITRKESEVIVESIFTTLVKVLRNGDIIEIRGFGSFRTRLRQPRVGRNPKTGARVEVPAKRIPYFKSSKELNDMVNNSGAGVKAALANQPDVPSKSAWTPRADRVPFRYPVELILEGGRRRSVRTLNISQSGMLVESVLPIKPGSRVRIRTKELPFLCVGALVRRCARQWFVHRISLEFDTLLSRLF
jgi:integration host factor subunit beta